MMNLIIIYSLLEWALGSLDDYITNINKMIKLLFKKLINGGQIVSSNDLTPLKIQHAREEGRMYVCDKGYGFVYLPPSNSNLTFGEAIKALLRGKKIQRQGWNGKGMYLYYVPANAYPPVTEIGETLTNENGLVPYDAYIAMKTVQNTVIPWQPSQADVLAEDWQIVE